MGDTKGKAAQVSSGNGAAFVFQHQLDGLYRHRPDMPTPKDLDERVFQPTKRKHEIYISAVQWEFHEIEWLSNVLSGRNLENFTDEEILLQAAMFRPHLFTALPGSTEGYLPHHRGARIILAAELLKANEGTAPVRRDLDMMGSRVALALDVIDALTKAEREALKAQESKA
jgi:hypothetical protein